MGSVKKILVPIAGSEASKRAAERAIAIAREHGSEITFITVAQLPDSYRSGGYRYVVIDMDYDLMIKNATEVERKMLDSFVDELETSGVTYKKEVVAGEPYDEILRVANEYECDYIVMGRRGFSKIKRFFVGSVTQRVISDAPCPVIVVKG